MPTAPRLARAACLGAASVALTALAALTSGCAAAEPDIAAITFPDASNAVAADPGAELAFGDVAWLPLGQRQAAVGLSVLSLTAGSAEDWASIVANPDAFANTAPVFVAYQYSWPTSDEEGITAYLVGVTADGDDVARVEDATGALVSCPLTLETDDEGAAIPGLGCFVVVQPSGAEVTAVRWYDVDASTEYQPTTDETPYYARPVTWGAAPTFTPPPSSAPSEG